MAQPTAHVTAAEISRMAGVTRATVSNWRRRHGDFPTPTGGTESSPLYDLGAVQAWLTTRGHAQAVDSREELRTAVRFLAPRRERTAALMGLALAFARRPSGVVAELGDLSDADLSTHATEAVTDVRSVLPGVGSDDFAFSADDGATLRALLRCVREEGGPAAIAVLAERDLEDSAATGTYGTPAPLAELAAKLLPSGAGRVLDPACGSGTLLAAAARRGATALFGQDSVPVQAQRAAVRLRLEAPQAEVAVTVGDSLRADAFSGLAVDAVLCTPPYGDRDWGHDELAYDPRWAYGVPARAESELAWVQHCLAHLTPGGWAVMVLPPATASRPSGRRVRAELVRSGAVRAVLALPAGAAPPFHVGLQVWVLRRPETGGPEQRSVLFIDMAGTAGPGDDERTTSSTRAGSTRPPLNWPDLTAHVLAHWEAFTADPDGFAGRPGIAGAVPVVDLLDDLADLTPARRVRVSRADVDPAELSARADHGRRELTEAAASLVQLSDVTRWTGAVPSAREWRTATASDLARGGALALLRTVPDPKGSHTGGPSEASVRLVLTAADVARGTGPTGDPAELGSDSAPVIAAGDVLVRAVAGGAGSMARVADEEDEGAFLGPQVHLLRPDPARLDPWFLAGFLDSEDNIVGASTGSTVLNVVPGRLRVPLVPLDEQRRYGEAFRHVHELRTRARRAARLAEEAAALLADGLTGGALIPSTAPAAGADPA